METLSCLIPPPYKDNCLVTVRLVCSSFHGYTTLSITRYIYYNIQNNQNQSKEDILQLSQKSKQIANGELYFIINRGHGTFSIYIIVVAENSVI